MKVVLDTNVLVSGIFWGGAPARVLDLWKEQKIELIASLATLDEYIRIIHCIADKLGRPDLYREWAIMLPSRLRLVSVRKTFRLCRDPKDDMFIDCAIAGKAWVIVTV